MELSKRLQAVADLLSTDLKVADIGCDHGFVSIYLVESGKASRCLAMDVNKGPLERAGEHILEKGLSTYIETRLSDGAKAIQFITNENSVKTLEVDAAIIAGMGGRLMIKIIQDSLEKFQAMQEFVLQPQSEIAKVRQFIRDIGFIITAEEMVLEEGKFYPIMKAVRNRLMSEDVKGCEPSSSEWEEKAFADSINKQELYDNFGEHLLNKKHPVLQQFLQKEAGLYEEILDSLKKQDSEKSKERQKEIKQKLQLIYQGLEWFQT